MAASQPERLSSHQVKVIVVFVVLLATVLLLTQSSGWRPAEKEENNKVNQVQTALHKHNLQNTSDTQDSIDRNAHDNLQHTKVDTQSNRFASINNNLGGYILSLSYFDQLTGATRRLQNLQCWAAFLNMSVVEPFLIYSRLGLDLGSLQRNDIVRFSDVYVLSEWNNWSREKHHYAPLAKWEEFLLNAPRTVVFVKLLYPTHRPVSQQNNLTLQPQVHECYSDLNTDDWNNLSTYLAKHDFVVSHAVCIDFSDPRHGIMTNSAFIHAVLQGYDRNNVTLIFSEWHGVSTTNRLIKVKGTNCPMRLDHTDLTEHVHHSQLISATAEEYIRRNMKSGPFVAVMVRSERALQKSVSEFPSMATCFEKIVATWRKVTISCRTNSTFLAVDIGKFGSQIQSSLPIYEHFQSLFSTLYGGKVSLHSWEQSFIDICPILSPGIIAVVQKEIAARSICLIQAGGGGFQSSTQGLYEKYHLHRKSYIEIVEYCA